ncbi:MAG: TetR/AcrR family transcriptional regulator [Gammaproteobacteria bacterium]|jgi:AcrR family transcriptional regulator|nr:TetR/AcrR family transcriptional regulator [Gammaproteobacteria bacterium]MBT4494896.1 TetR/AcrR family transcriptional regulator [Gammaproteobacteria bacterium]MBT7371876.1 TetR/AcrR family transcriptional regulator [Gammaproteobacteria bacterium]
MSTKSVQPKNIDTRDRILDAAEELFVEHGFAATSLRAIATRADVNLAATNYHFGSKMGLLGSVFHRHIFPVNEERLKRLKALERSERSLTLNEILEALFLPLIEGLPHERLPALMGRIFSEPESITKPIIEKEFAEVAARFQAAIVKVLPDLPIEILRWRFHLMIGSMIHMLKFQSPIGSEYSRDMFTKGIEELINYSVAGLSRGQNLQGNPDQQVNHQEISK